YRVDPGGARAARGRGLVVRGRAREDDSNPLRYRLREGGGDGGPQGARVHQVGRRNTAASAHAFHLVRGCAARPRRRLRRTVRVRRPDGAGPRLVREGPEKLQGRREGAKGRLATSAIEDGRSVPRDRRVGYVCLVSEQGDPEGARAHPPDAPRAAQRELPESGV